MKKIIEVLRKIIFSGFLLYGYNLVAVNFSLVVPINFFNIAFLTLLGAPGLLVLVLYKLIIM